MRFDEQEEPQFGLEGPGKVILSNILRKGPPSRGGHRSSAGSRMSASRPRTAGSVASGYSGSIRSVGTGFSNLSVMSGASRESFGDRFARSNTKQQKLLMMQKKMELNETMQKKIQIQHGRPCTPEVLRELNSRVDKMITLKDMKRAESGEESVLQSSLGIQRLNRSSGRISVTEALDTTPALSHAMNEMSSSGMLRRPMTNQSSRRGSSRGSLPAVRRVKSAGSIRSSFGGDETPDSQAMRNQMLGSKTPVAMSYTRPWANDSTRGASSRGGSRGSSRNAGSLVETMKDRFKECDATRRSLTQALAQAGALEGPKVLFVDFENLLKTYGIRLSYQEILYLRKAFAGGGNYFHFQNFANAFWGSGAPQLAESGIVISPLYPANGNKLEEALVAKMREIQGEREDNTPPALVLNKAFLAADRDRTGVIPVTSLDAIFRQIGIGIDPSVAKMFGERFKFRQNQKLVDYQRVISSVFPAELTMEDRQLSSSAKFYDGMSGETNAPHAKMGPEVTGSFFDVAEKLKEEVKGNRKNLRACFAIFSEESDQLTIAQFCQALALLKVDLSERAVRKQLGHFIKNGLIHYKEIMADLFPADEDLRDDIESKEEIDRLETNFRKSLGKKWGSVLEAFVEIDADRSGDVDVAEFALAMKEGMDINTSESNLKSLIQRFDHDGSGHINFAEFMDLFGEKSKASNLVKQQDVKLVVKQIREAIEARLDGGGGGGLLKAFKFFDRDRSGTLTYGEMAAGIEHYANMLLEPAMLAKLMKVYDPDYVGSIDFQKFTENVMGSSAADASSIVQAEFIKSAGSAPRSWTITELEAGIKAKMERSWTQLKEACRDADIDNSNTISPVELRGLLERFCFTMSDKQFSLVAAKFFPNGKTEVSYDEFMLYFAKLGGTYYLELPKEMSVEAAKRKIAEKINEKLSGGTGGLLRAFQMFDRDRSGSLSYDEFAQILREVACMTMDPDLSERVMASYDQDGDGAIDYHEFVGQVMGSDGNEKSSFDNKVTKKDQQMEASAINRRWEAAEVNDCLTRKLVPQGAMIKRAFNSCDTRREGKIAVSDLRTILNKMNLAMTDMQFDDLCNQFELTQGKMDYEDFLQAYVNKNDFIPKDISIISDMNIEDAKALIKQKILERTGTGQSELLRAFKVLDRDRSGLIHAHEFREAMRTYASLNFTEELAEKLMQEFDEDGDGAVDYAEFTKLVMGSTRDTSTGLQTGIRSDSKVESRATGNDIDTLRRKVRSQWKELIRAFREADTDNSGNLDPSELNRVLRRYNIDLTDTQMGDLLSKIDEDGDGEVSYGEFMKFFAKGQAEDLVIHKKISNLTLEQAKRMIQEKIDAKMSSSFSNSMREAFQVFDHDRSGGISYAEFRQALIDFTSLEFEDDLLGQMLADFDIDDSGSIDYEEFLIGVGDKTGATGINTRKAAKHAKFKKDPEISGEPTSPQPVSRPSTPSQEQHQANGSAPFMAAEAKKLLQYIAEKVEQKSKNVRVVFRNFDEDKSGSVDYTEFRRGLAHLGITLSDDEFQTLLDIIDNDQSGTIDYNEFVEDLKSVDEQQGGFFGDPGAEKKIVAAHPTQAPQVGEAMIDAHTHITGSGRSGQTVLAFIADKVEQKSKNVRVVFRNFDEDKSGSVDYDEFRRGLAHLGITLSDEEFQAMLGIIDNDQSGTIDYNEFVEDLKHTDQQTTGFGA